MKSVFDEGKKGKEKETVLRNPVPEFETISRRVIAAIRNQLDADEVRGMAEDKVACPTLKVKPCFFFCLFLPTFV